MNTEPNESSGLDSFVSDEIKARIAVTRGVTVTSAAEALVVRRKYLSARVNGSVPFASTLLDRIARLLGTTASEVVAAAERRRRLDAGEGQETPGARRVAS